MREEQMRRPAWRVTVRIDSTVTHQSLFKSADEATFYYDAVHIPLHEKRLEIRRAGMARFEAIYSKLMGEE